jgi:predicted Zn finger-like uncharacterized protein
MFTVCPKCALTLVVTTEDLRVAQGYVRCGRCSSVFNALARLAEERQTPAESLTPAPPTPAASPPSESPRTPPPAVKSNAPAPNVTDEDAIPEEALEFDPSKTDVSSVFVEPPPNPQWTAATGTFKAMIAANQEAAPAQDSDSQIDVELDPELLASILNVEPPAPPVPRAETAAPPPAKPAAISRPRPPPREAPPAADAATDASSVAPQPAPRHVAQPARPAPEAPVSAPSAANLVRVLRKRRPAEDVDERTMARLLPHLWRAGAAVALLVLLGQIVNHYRDQLAATARFHRSLTALYASLGVPLVPRWDVRAYEVRQLGASVEPASSGLITVRASIKNAAPQPQPLPLLRVTLQDRFGNRIAARDVAPPSYLPHATPASAYLSAGERIDAEMGFVDPGANAVGFEIDACLPTRGGEVTCANDATPRARE